MTNALTWIECLRRTGPRSDFWGKSPWKGWLWGRVRVIHFFLRYNIEETFQMRIIISILWCIFFTSGTRWAISIHCSIPLKFCMAFNLTVIDLLQVRRPWLRKEKSLAQGHIARKRQSQHLNSDLLTSRLLHPCTAWDRKNMQKKRRLRGRKVNLAIYSHLRFQDSKILGWNLLPGGFLRPAVHLLLRLFFSPP